jgi:anion-transporting  ArsA/GET3 family ATPase
MSADLLEVLTHNNIVVTCGAGGVGKTTVAAAAATMAAVHTDRKVLVLTVDPARRLATAMGLEDFGNAEKQVPINKLKGKGAAPKGELWAAMLDTQQSWDDLITRHAPDAKTRDAILDNQLYRSISRTFVQSHDYIAMERLYELHRSGDYDLIIIDTPPTRNAIDFLSAPERMADFFSSRLLKWLIAPYRSKLVSSAAKPFLSVADKILGAQFLADIAHFFILFQSMYDGFVERANAVSALLEADTTSFVVVSTLENAPAREATFFIEELESRRLELGAAVFNKALPDLFGDPGAFAAAEALLADPGEAVAAVPKRVGSPAAVERVLSEVATRFLDYRVVAEREATLRTSMASTAETVVTVPYLDGEITDLEGLVAMGAHLWPADGSDG